tara:strand:+ start:1861 stop:5148 length:3288 start_codon:yes stop_codon:yes gene_type:complete
MTNKFTHLHLHSEFSTKDAINKIADIPKTAKELGMDSIALTDHGTLAGIKKFYDACIKEEVKPIIGCEMYVSPNSMTEKEKDCNGSSAYHFLVLAQNETGYKNLVKLSSKAYTEGFYYKPRIDIDLLSQYSEGLICTTACLGGILWKTHNAFGANIAEDQVLKLKEILGNKLFLEVQNNGIAEQETLNNLVLDLAKKHDISIVGTNDVHYTHACDWELQHEVVCIGHRKTLDNPTYPKQNLECYIKSSEEMEKALAHLPKEAFYNTIHIANAIESNYLKDLRVDMPQFPGLKSPANEILRNVAGWGLYNKFEKINESVPKKYKERLNYELDVIDRMGYSDYFLIVWDYIKHANDCGIQVGPGRGSGAGSLVCWSLDITKPDPMKAGLFFERFLNPDRISMPDLDIDFDPRRLDDVLSYVSGKYGQENVSKISTYNRFFGKQSVRDLARINGLSAAEGNTIAVQIPDPVYGRSKPMAEVVQENPNLLRRWPSIIPQAIKIDGMTRHNGIHACGVVISPEPISNYTPVCKSSKTDSLITQWDHDDLEAIGFVKFDFLSIDNLAIIADTLKLIEENYDKVIDLQSLSLDNSKAMDVICNLDLDGIFQLESDGMANLIAEVQPENIDELSDIIALYRPGPIDAGFLKSYIKNKKSGTRPYDLNAKLATLLEDTYYVPVYQEQIMKMAQILAGYTLAEADDLRRAIGKKKPELMALHKEKFVNGLVELSNMSASESKRLWDALKGWANYGFNKAHSYSYAMLSYYTAYLKAYYPLEFMCALVSVRIEKHADKVHKYLKAARRKGIKILGADINSSEATFKISKSEDNTIVFGLAALHGIGKTVSRAIVQSRAKKPYTSLKDFMARVPSRALDKSTLKTLVSVGAFDCLNYDRADMYKKSDSISQYYKELKEYRKRFALYEERQNEIQTYLTKYGDVPSKIAGEKRPRKKKEPTKPEKINIQTGQSKIGLDILNEEYKITSLYLSAHPSEFIIIEDGDVDAIVDIKELLPHVERTMILTFPTFKSKWDNGKWYILEVHDRDGMIAEASMTRAIYNKLESPGMTIATAKIVTQQSRGDIVKVKIKVIEDILYKTPLLKEENE